MSTYHAPSASCTAVAVGLAIVVLSWSVSDACFIRNCPKGGKRSMESTMLPKRECMRCGQGGQGQCVGPNICCSSVFGCRIGTAETEVCQQENQSVSPCFVIGDVCGARDAGNCVADGVCCDSESCAMNERCRQDNSSKDDILHLLQKLLKERDLD